MAQALRAHKRAVAVARRTQMQDISRARAAANRAFKKAQRQRQGVGAEAPAIAPAQFKYIITAFGTRFECQSNYKAPNGRYFVFAKAYTTPLTFTHTKDLFILTAGAPFPGLNDFFSFNNRILNLIENKRPADKRELLYPMLVLPANYKMKTSSLGGLKTSFTVLPAPVQKDGSHRVLLFSNLGTFEGKVYCLGANGLGLFLDDKLKLQFLIARPNHIDKAGKAVFIGTSSQLSDGALIFKVNIPFDREKGTMTFKIKPNVQGRPVYAAYPSITNNAGEPLVLLKTEGKL